jgi:Delta24-sterol reductase
MAIPWSHGTLGFLVAAEIRIIPATRFVRLEYIPTYSAAEFTQVFAEKSLEREKNHFVEGISYSRNLGVVMTGTMTDTAEPGKVSPLDILIYFIQRLFHSSRTDFVSIHAGSE